MRGRPNGPGFADIVWLHLATIVTAVGALTPVDAAPAAAATLHRRLGLHLGFRMAVTALRPSAFVASITDRSGIIHILSAWTLIQVR